VYRIVIDQRAVDAISELPAYARARLRDAIAEQLAHDPTPYPSQRHKKQLRPLIVPWSGQAEAPWQLTVVPYRILYDVDHDDFIVAIRLVVLKEPGKKLKDIL
jgi:mRNA-degrading endonuclease RelE of RelBE toxin-antitoxin system